MDSGAGVHFSVVVGATPAGGIGNNGSLPWPRLAGDMQWFKETTSKTQDTSKKNAVVMGRRTWESIPEKFRPLPGRLNIVLSRTDPSELGMPEGVQVCGNFEDTLGFCEEKKDEIENVFVIGGSSLFDFSFSHPGCKTIYYTEVKKHFQCDTFIERIPETFRARSPIPGADHSDNGVPYTFKIFDRVEDSISALPTRLGDPATLARHEEYQYLSLIQEIMDNGITRNDRTGTGTIAKFGTQMRFSLRDNVFPLLTTKRVFWRGLAEELLWFIAGATNGNTLTEKGVRIWDANGSREFLDKSGLNHREVGDLGPIYGFQWRHFGAKYTNMHADYSGQGVDQLAQVIDKIKNNPTDRRIIMSAWNPAALPEMALPPCHMFCQFFVANGELSCLMYQRSCDMGLGVPFNIASYSLLTRLIAQVCGLKAGEFVHTLGDYHIYNNHIEPLKEQLKREPKPFPKLFIDPSITDIDKFEFSHFTLEGYKPHPTIKMEMSA